MMYRILALGILGLWWWGMGMPSAGQDAILQQLYGNGVHAYFAGQYEEAHEYFTSAIRAGTKDPRVYYFRGLCYLQLGRDQEAQQDFAKGAELELADVNQLYPVGRALQRVQGKHRLRLEEYRQEARLASYKRQRAAEKARGEGLRQRELELLRQQSQPSSAPAQPPIEAPTAPQEKRAPLPFMEKPAEKMPTAEVPPEEKTQPVPGGLQQKPEEKPAPSPFEMPGQQPAEKPSMPGLFEEKPAAQPSMPGPAEEKPAEKPTLPSPFGEQPAEKPAPSPFEMPGEQPAEKPSMPGLFEEKPAAQPSMPGPAEEKPAENSAAQPAPPEEKPAGPAKSPSLLRGLFGAVQKTVEDLAKPAGQGLGKVLPGQSPSVPARPKLETPVPFPLPGLPSMPGAEPGIIQPKPERHPFEEQPAGKSSDPFARSEKSSESTPKQPAKKAPALPNPFE